MLWKIGLVLVILGMAVTASSCHFFGSFAEQMTEQRQVSVATWNPKTKAPLSAVVDTTSKTRIRVEARVETPQSVLDEGDLAGISEFRVPFNLIVRDRDGRDVHREAGAVRATQIVPEPESPHFDNFDPVVTASFETQAFAPGPGGFLEILVDADTVSERGFPVRRIQVITLDRVPEDLQRHAMGGVASLIVGPALFLLGGLVLVIGLFLRSGQKKRKQAAYAGPVPASSTTRSVGKTALGQGRVPPPPPSS